MRRWLRPLWVILALLFLLEAWLWDHLQPLVARIVNLIPWDAFKNRLARLIERLPPWATLLVFVVPFIAMLPLNFSKYIFWRHAIGSGRPVSFCSSNSSASASPLSSST